MGGGVFSSLFQRQSCSVDDGTQWVNKWNSIVFEWKFIEKDQPWPIIERKMDDDTRWPSVFCAVLVPVRALSVFGNIGTFSIYGYFWYVGRTAWKPPNDASPQLIFSREPPINRAPSISSPKLFSFLLWGNLFVYIKEPAGSYYGALSNLCATRLLWVFLNLHAVSLRGMGRHFVLPQNYFTGWHWEKKTRSSITLSLFPRIPIIMKTNVPDWPIRGDVYEQYDPATRHFVGWAFMFVKILSIMEASLARLHTTYLRGMQKFQTNPMLRFVPACNMFSPMQTPLAVR